MAAFCFDCVSLFGEMFAGLTTSGVSARAYQRGLWQLSLWNPRDYAEGNYRRVDERPFGGGPGMVMLPEPLYAALSAAKARQQQALGRSGPVVCLSPQGRPLTDQKLRQWLAECSGLILLCGRYEGIDERLLHTMVDEEVSVGDFVVSGGELPAMLLMDGLIRLIPGVLGCADSADEDSFVAGLLDCPHYTRPLMWQGQTVPEVLLSGHHENIRRWRRLQSLTKTRERRPDLFKAWLAQGVSQADTHLLTEMTDSVRTDES